MWHFLKKGILSHKFQEYGWCKWYSSHSKTLCSFWFVLFLNFTHLKKLPVVHHLINYFNMSCIKSFFIKKSQNAQWTDVRLLVGSISKLNSYSCFRSFLVEQGGISMHPNPRVTFGVSSALPWSPSVSQVLTRPFLDSFVPTGILLTFRALVSKKARNVNAYTLNISFMFPPLHIFDNHSNTFCYDIPRV